MQRHPQFDSYLLLWSRKDIRDTSQPGLYRPRTHGNVFLRFCIVSSNELVVLDSLENSKQYQNAGKRFRVYGGLKQPLGRNKVYARGGW